MPLDAKLRQRRRWPWILLAAGLALAALVVSWWQLQGVDFLYGQIRPDDARLLNGLEDLAGARVLEVGGVDA